MSHAGLVIAKDIEELKRVKKENKAIIRKAGLNKS